MKTKELVEANMSMKTCDFFSPNFLCIYEAPCFILPSPCFPPEHLLLPAKETFVLFEWLDYESQIKHEGLFWMMPSKALIKREEEVLVSGSKGWRVRATQSASLSLGAELSVWQETIIRF